MKRSNYSLTLAERLDRYDLAVRALPADLSDDAHRFAEARIRNALRLTLFDLMNRPKETEETDA